MFGWREIYMSSSMADCAKVRNALDEKCIVYRYKIRSASGDINGRLSVIKSDYAFQYYVYVKKQDFEQAKYLADDALRRQGGA